MACPKHPTAINYRIPLPPPIVLTQGYRAFITYAPIYTDNDFDGFIVGIFDTVALLKTVLASDDPDNFTIKIFDGEKLLYQNTNREEGTLESNQATLETITQLTLFNRMWTISVEPTDKFLRTNKSPLAIIALLGGGLFALLTGFGIHTAMISRQRSQLLQKKSLQLQISENKTQAILNNTLDGLLTIDSQGTIASFNKSCEKIFGYRSAEVIGKKIKTLLSDPSSTRTQGYFEEHRDVPIASLLGIPHELEGRRKNGQRFPIELSANEIYIDREKLFIGIIRDITERKEAEEALQQANAELEEFAYRTSHDLRSPLVSSIGILNIAIKSVEKGEVEKTVKSLSLVQGSLKKLETLVQDILNLTKAKNIGEAKQEINLQQLIEESINKFTHLENFDRLDIQTELAFDEKLTAERSRLTLIVENLISNAIKYQDTSNENAFIRISTAKTDGYFVLTVADNGLGIPEEQRGKLFTMFNRFHTKVSFGSGLGLYMVRKSAEILGGTLIFDALEKGSAFTLKLPLSEDRL